MRLSVVRTSSWQDERHVSRRQMRFGRLKAMNKFVKTGLGGRSQRRVLWIKSFTVNIAKSTRCTEAHLHFIVILCYCRLLLSTCFRQYVVIAVTNWRHQHTEFRSFPMPSTFIVVYIVTVFLLRWYRPSFSISAQLLRQRRLSMTAKYFDVTVRCKIYQTDSVLWYIWLENCQ